MLKLGKKIVVRKFLIFNYLIFKELFYSAALEFRILKRGLSEQ